MAWKGYKSNRKYTYAESIYGIGLLHLGAVFQVFAEVESGFYSGVLLQKNGGDLRGWFYTC
jgi:hypothetical protein